MDLQGLVNGLLQRQRLPRRPCRRKGVVSQRCARGGHDTVMGGAVDHGQRDVHGGAQRRGGA